MIERLLLALAGLMGAAGVALGAAATHAVPGANLDVAAQMLLFHASAAIGALLLAQAGRARPTLALAAGAGFVLGAALFSGDLAVRAFYRTTLWRLMAPTGGSVLIAAWIGLALAALAAPRARPRR